MKPPICWQCPPPALHGVNPSRLKVESQQISGVATACAHGWLDECKCVKPESFMQEFTLNDFKFDKNLMSYEGTQMSTDDWNWSGCSYGVNYGIATSRKIFTRTGGFPNPLRKLERHNLKAGRLVGFLWLTEIFRVFITPTSG